MKPFRTILFAADFSKDSDEAFRVACSLAAEHKTRVVVLHVVEPTLVSEDPVYFGQQSIQFHASEPNEARLEALLQHLREVYAPGFAIDMDYSVREGDAVKEILRIAQEMSSDLIVMGTHGRALLRRLLFGSVATAVIRGARCPVLALRSTGLAQSAKKLRVIVHPTDFSEGSEAALQVARSVARDRGARLVLLHVDPIYAPMEIGMPPELDIRCRRETLEAIRDRVDGPDLKFPVETWFSRGAAATEIVRVAEEIGCGLIVMGTHGRTGLGRLLLGNTAESVLPDATCPVMIVKASQPGSRRTAAPSTVPRAVTADLTSAS
jgi:nucleotide-binding universal stress UspA family protein